MSATQELARLQSDRALSEHAGRMLSVMTYLREFLGPVVANRLWQNATASRDAKTGRDLVVEGAEMETTKAKVWAHVISTTVEAGLSTYVTTRVEPKKRTNYKGLEFGVYFDPETRQPRLFLVAVEFYSRQRLGLEWKLNRETGILDFYQWGELGYTEGLGLGELGFSESSPSLVDVTSPEAVSEILAQMCDAALF